MSNSSFNVTGSASGSGTVTTVNSGTGLTGGPITTSGTLALANTAVTPGAYTSANITVDQQGRLTAAANGSSGGTVTSVATGTGLTGGPITTAGTVSLVVPVVVADGGTGLTSSPTPYGVVCSGTTGTAALQNVASVGTAGQALVSNGAAALPTFQTLGAAPGGGIVGGSVNLLGTAAGGNKMASWTADQLIAYTALGGTNFLGTSLSLAFNGATTGAGGMDTGATPSASSLYIYAIYDPGSTTWSTLGTTSGSGSAIYTGGSMPSGYTASALIWAGVTNGSGNILAFGQYANRIYLGVPIFVLNSNTQQSSWTSLSVASAVPTNAKLVSGMVGSNYTGAQARSATYIASNSSGANYQAWAGITTTSLFIVFSAGTVYRDILLISSQTVYYQLPVAGTNALISVTDYAI